MPAEIELMTMLFASVALFAIVYIAYKVTYKKDEQKEWEKITQKVIREDWKDCH